MNATDVRLSRLAAGQHGLVSRRQLHAAGMTARQLDRRLAAGALVGVHRGVYRVAGVPATYEQSVLAACLAAGGVASHRTAARLWGLRGVVEGSVGDAVEVTVARRRRPDLAGVVAHATCQLQRAEVVVMRAIPLTSPERTLLDLGAVAPRRVEAAMEDALLRGLVTLGSLRRLLERVGEHGRDGSGVLRSLVAERHPGAAPTESRLEDAILRILRAHGLPEPVRQHPVALPAGREARIDLAYPDVKVGIEADGRIWHSGREDFARDRARANQLAGLGWTLLRYGWHDVRGGDGLAAEVANVRRAIGGRRAG